MDAMGTMGRAGALLICVLCCNACVRGQMVSKQQEEAIDRILLRNNHVGAEPMNKQLLNIADSMGLTREGLEDLLLKYAKEEVTKESYVKCERRRRSILMLGMLRAGSAVSTLAAIAREDRDFQAVALRSIARIGADDLPDYAEQVLSAPSVFEDIARFNFYRELAAYVGVDAYEMGKLPTAGVTGDTDLPRRIKAVLMLAVQKDEDASNGKVLDEILKIADPAYAQSFEREDVLTRRLAATKVEVLRQYFGSELETLRGIPEGQRPHIVLPSATTTGLAKPSGPGTTHDGRSGQSLAESRQKASGVLPGSDATNSSEMTPTRTAPPPDAALHGLSASVVLVAVGATVVLIVGIAVWLARRGRERNGS
jgi:hypothetical protein